jgi:hypothetical protein
LSRVDQGRVALLLSDQIWLWSRGHQGGGPQAELLRRVAHWLMRQPELEENALTARMLPGGAAGARLAVTRSSTEEGPVPAVTVTGPDGASQTLALKPTGPGQASATVTANAPGVWQVSDGTHTAFAAADPNDGPEFADLRATAGVLDSLAGRSGGSIHWLAAVGAANGGLAEVPALRRTEPGRASSGSSWIGLPMRGAHVVTALAAVPLLPDWAALFVLGGLVVLAWWREGA